MFLAILATLLALGCTFLTPFIFAFYTAMAGAAASDRQSGLALLIFVGGAIVHALLWSLAIWWAVTAWMHIN